MAAFNKFNSFAEAVFEKKHNLGADTLKVALSNTAPVAGNTVLADIVQIANGNGYTTGGLQATLVSSAQSAGLYKCIVNDVVWTATGAMGPLRYPVLYNDSATNKELIGWWDHGSSITLASGETYTGDFNATDGVIQAQ